jgi:hypothetical protein
MPATSVPETKSKENFSRVNWEISQKSPIGTITMLWIFLTKCGGIERERHCVVSESYRTSHHSKGRRKGPAEM